MLNPWSAPARAPVLHAQHPSHCRVTRAPEPAAAKCPRSPPARNAASVRAAHPAAHEPVCAGSRLARRRRRRARDEAVPSCRAPTTRAWPSFSTAVHAFPARVLTQAAGPLCTLSVCQTVRSNRLLEPFAQTVCQSVDLESKRFSSFGFRLTYSNSMSNI